MLISEVQATDAGKYECSAQSMAGSRTAPPVTLKVFIYSLFIILPHLLEMTEKEYKYLSLFFQVLAPPTVLRGPQDTEVIEGEGLDLPCELTGDPLPIVVWLRENGNLPEGRSRILLDNTLRIEDTRPEDQGRYVCKGHNEGGNVTIAVKLHVYGKYSKFHLN